jgi:hypothetical protein
MEGGGWNRTQYTECTRVRYSPYTIRKAERFLDWIRSVPRSRYPGSRTHPWASERQKMRACAVHLMSTSPRPSLTRFGSSDANITRPWSSVPCSVMYQRDLDSGERTHHLAHRFIYPRLVPPHDPLAPVRPRTPVPDRLVVRRVAGIAGGRWEGRRDGIAEELVDAIFRSITSY